MKCKERIYSQGVDPFQKGSKTSLTILSNWIVSNTFKKLYKRMQMI